MIRSLIASRIASEERRVGVPLEYVRHMVRTSLAAFARYALFVPMSRYRRRLPAEAFHVARIVATQRQDCGTCLQIVVNLARRDALDRDVIDAVISGRIDSLRSDLQDVYRFTVSVLQASYDEGALRDRLRARYGEEGLIELAFAVATAPVFPLIKRALGYAVSCSAVSLDV